MAAVRALVAMRVIQVERRVQSLCHSERRTRAGVTR
ncbi:hypothetical protein SVIOM74S_04749 [Streptomyces violarus]